MNKRIGALIEGFTSPFEPKGLKSKNFYVLNLFIFFIIGISFFLLKKNDFFEGNKDFSFWKIWIVLFLGTFIKIFVSNKKMSLRFAGLVIYAQNRAMLIMVLVVLILFPVEIIMLKMNDNYMINGFFQTSFAIKILGYLYFYVIFFRLVYYFWVESRKNQSSIRG